MSCYGSSTTLQNSVIAFSTEGEAIYGDVCDPALTCCDVYGNAGGDYVGCIADQLGINGNNVVTLETRRGSIEANARIS